MLRWAAMLVLAAALAGCSSFAQFAESLNERQIASCVSWRGGMRAGALAGGQLAVDAVTVTGGAVLSECAGYLRER